MEITIYKLFLCSIGVIAFFVTAINCASLSSSVSSSPVVIKKINSVNNLSFSPSSSSPSPIVLSSSVSPLKTDDSQPIETSFNSLTSSESGVVLVGGRQDGLDSVHHSKVSPHHQPIGDYHPIRSSYVPNFGPKVKGVNFAPSQPSSSPSMLTSAFSSSFSPSKLFPSLFSSSSTSSRVSPSSPGNSFSLRPINRLLELFPFGDYSNDDSPHGRDNYQPKVFYPKRQQPPQPHGDKIHPDQHGNSLNSPIFYSHELYPDLTKQGSISRPLFTLPFTGSQSQPTRRSLIKSIVDRLFG